MKVKIRLIGIILCVSMIFPEIADADIPFKRGINLANALEAPKGDYWGVTIENKYFTKIKEEGFDCVRIPIRFSDYTENKNGQVTLEKDFMQMLDNHINSALNEGLYVIIDFQNFNEFMDSPERYGTAFIAIWEQLALHYKNYSPKLIFELLNEPHNKLQGEIWNKYLSSAIMTIRKTNKQRYIVVDADSYDSVDGLNNLILPDDKYLLATFHYYEPYDFTYQSNEYLGEQYAKISNIKWTGSRAEEKYLRERLTLAKTWANKNNISIFLGEFGANNNVNSEMRAVWTKTVREVAENLDIPWIYWDFGGQFAAYDIQKNQWKNFITEALFR
ncbi:glycoside hydrolase family 5 protein [Pectinatus haikarae]|uniref:Endoglucanase n=1 Tax=Pectinatus haikarae TaxID=349096 RepID=A0ABT9YB25_9FIRM|nr:glycoside hydrolase family 5 protein [Pectinatus haikarae]MDQ0204314.1 endoglucanase [Pectinatus haikarae]